MIRRAAVLALALAAMLLGAPAFAQPLGGGLAPAVYSAPNTFLRNAKTGKCLTVTVPVPDNNLRAVQYTCDNDASRRWDIASYGSGVQIRNVATGKCLTIAGGTSTANGVDAVQFDCDSDLSRQWKLENYPESGELTNVKTAQCITPSGGSVANNARVVQTPCTGGPQIQWAFDGQPDGSFQVRNLRSGKCLTIAGGTSTANNVEGVQFTCDTDTSRRWVRSATENFQLRNVKTGKCLTIAGGTSPTAGLATVQFTCDTDTSRRWNSF